MMSLQLLTVGLMIFGAILCALFPQFILPIIVATAVTTVISVAGMHMIGSFANSPEISGQTPRFHLKADIVKSEKFESSGLSSLTGTSESCPDSGKQGNEDINLEF